MDTFQGKQLIKKNGSVREREICSPQPKGSWILQTHLPEASEEAELGSDDLGVGSAELSRRRQTDHTHQPSWASDFALAEQCELGEEMSCIHVCSFMHAGGRSASTLCSRALLNQRPGENFPDCHGGAAAPRCLGSPKDYAL